MSDVEPIKILVVCGSLGVGGAEVQAAKLLPCLDRRRFRVEVAYYNQGAGFPRDLLLREGVPVHDLGTGSHWNRWRFLAQAYRFMRREKFDIVHAWMASANHYARLPAMASGVPVIIGGLQGKIELHGRWPLLYSLMNVYCSGWVVNSQALRKHAEERLAFMRNCPVWVVRNGLEMDDRLIFRRDEATVYDELRGTRPVIGMVGRLHPVKNHRLFLEMARDLTEKGVDADYWIIGDGPERAGIEQMISELKVAERVRLLGLRHDVDAALSRMTLLVLTSDSESCPNAVLEAMRAGLPVVATRCTDFTGIIAEGENGFTVDLNDRAALVDRVRRILAEPELGKAMGARSRAMVEDGFSLQAAVDDLAGAYLAAARSVGHRALRLQAKLAAGEGRS